MDEKARWIKSLIVKLIMVSLTIMVFQNFNSFCLAQGNLHDIVFISDRSGYKEIWTASSDNLEDAKQITHYNGSNIPVTPKWSPDGKWIAFEMRLKESDKFSFEIFLVDSAGIYDPIQLTNYPGESWIRFPDWDLDSSWIYYVLSWPLDHGEIWKVNIETRQVEPVKQIPNVNYGGFDLSTSGRYRVEIRQNGCCWTPNHYVSLCDLISSTEKIILATDGKAEWWPRISNKEKMVVFDQAYYYYPPYNLWVMNIDGTCRRQLTFSTNSHNSGGGVFSPDDTKILFHSSDSGNYDLYLYDLVNDTIQPFLTGLENTTQPDWIARDQNPDIQVDPIEYDFGDVELGRPSSMFLTISNVGGGELSINDLYLKYPIEYDPFAFSLPDSLPRIVTPETPLEIEVTYSPSFLYAVQSNTLVIESNDADEGIIEIPLYGRGVVAEEPSEAVNTVQTYIDISLENGTLWGEGSGNSADNRINALKNMIESAGDLIEEGDTGSACDQLQSILKKVDGEAKPPDFVAGDAVSGVATAITEIMTDLGCQ